MTICGNVEGLRFILYRVNENEHAKEGVAIL